MLRSVRMILAGVTGSSVLVPLTLLPSQSHVSRGELIASAVAAALTLGVTVLWLTRWPTRLQSQIAVVLGALCVGGWSLAQPSAALAALACTALAIPSCYIAFFHSLKLLIFNGVIAIAITTTVVLRLAQEVNLSAAAFVFWLSIFLNFWLALGIWGMSRAMGTYAVRSEEDALTGLLNRRAFTGALSNLLAHQPPTHTHLAVVMVDLDNFKRINDTHGHSAGDRALRAVANLLREHIPDDAVLCRVGGEEFLVALTSETGDVEPLAMKFCAALEELSPEVTASVGTASARLPPVKEADIAQLIDELVTVADTAMYAAKRRGGNQVHQSVLS